jgi:Ca2+-binding RTX toxin-like protein
MKPQLVTVAGSVLLLLACSPAGVSRESAPAAASGSPQSGAAAGSASEQAGESDAPTEPGPEHARLRCFGKRPTIVGTPSDDRIQGTDGRDVIMSLGGDDTVGDLDERDTVCAGTGDDDVVADQGGRRRPRILISLGAGADDATVVRRSGVVLAGAGNDTLVFTGNNGDTQVDLGGGDDVVRADFVPQASVRTFNLCVQFSSARGPVRVHLGQERASGQGRDRLVGIRCVFGSRFDDLLIGSGGWDSMAGRGGRDLLIGGPGGDGVSGGAGPDLVYSGRGDDAVSGERGRDRLYGGPGHDLMAGGAQGDYMDGGDGGDFMFGGIGCAAHFDATPQQVKGMSFGADPNELFGRSGDDWLFGEQGNDRLDGGPGTDGGSGGYRDGRIDWITSVETVDECELP